MSILDSNNAFSGRRILDTSKLKEFVDDNFKFDENGSKFFKWIENTMVKGEIALHQDKIRACLGKG